MGDRIAVIDHGRICQVGTPTEIYDDPADRFVATFVGTPPMNLVARNGGFLGFRPENFLPKEMIDDDAFTEFSFRVDRSEYLGSERIVYGALEGFDPNQVVTAKLPPAQARTWCIVRCAANTRICRKRCYLIRNSSAPWIPERPTTLRGTSKLAASRQEFFHLRSRPSLANWPRPHISD